MDTCDRMGKPFLKLLKDVSDHQAHRISGAVNDDPHTRRAHRGAPPLEFRNKAYLHNIALVHVSLISTVMQRVLGHTVTPRAGTELDTPHRRSNSTVTPQS